MTFFSFFEIQFKKVNSFSAAAAIPTIGKQHAANIGKDCVDEWLLFHVDKILLSGSAVFAKIAGCDVAARAIHFKYSIQSFPNLIHQSICWYILTQFPKHHSSQLF